MILALALAALLSAPEGRAPLRFPLDMVLVDRDPSSAGELDPLETWLRDRLPKALPEVERVVFLHTTSRRFEPGEGAGSPVVTTSRELEVAGKPSLDPDAVRSFLLRLASQATRPLRVHATAFERSRERGAEPLRAGVALLEEIAWRQELAAAERVADAGSTAAARRLGNVEADVPSGVPAILLGGEEVAYVADYEMTQSGETLIADPVIETLRSGVLVEATPILHPDGGTLTLAVTVTIADLARPMKTVETNLGVGAPVSIQVPEVRQVRWESGPLDLPLEKAQFVVRGLFVPASAGTRDREIEVFLRVRPVDGEPPPERPAGRVHAVDEESRLVFVTWLEGGKEGDRLGLYRGGARIGTLELVRTDRALRFTVARAVSGAAPEPGDEIR